MTAPAARPAPPLHTPPLPEGRPAQLGLSAARLQRASDAFKREVDKGTVPGVTLLVARKGQSAGSMRSAARARARSRQ